MFSSIVIASVFYIISSKGQSASTGRACEARSGGRTAEWGTTCYEFFSDERNWFDASNLCHQHGGSLVSVTGAALQRWLETAIEQLLVDRAGVWIGLNDRRGNGNYTWHDVNGTGRYARYFNWLNGQPNYSGLAENCVCMLRRFRWQWINDECYSPHHGYSFVCEFGFSSDVSNLTEATNPDLALPHEHVTEVVVTVGKVRSSRDLPITTIGLNEQPEEQRDSKVTENGFKDDTVFIAVGAAALVAVAVGLSSIVLCRYRRRLKHSTAAGSQVTVTALVVSNPPDDTAVDPRDPTLVTSDRTQAPLCSACRHLCEIPSRDFSEYAECITNDEHAYAQLAEPWLRSDDVGSSSNGVQPISSGLTEEQAESAQFETEPLVTCRYLGPKCTVGSVDTLVENNYVSIESRVNYSSKTDDRRFSPVMGDTSDVRYQSDTTADCYCVNE